MNRPAAPGGKVTPTTGRMDASGLTPVAAGAGALQVPGPVDRVHFLDEQRRYRKASRRFSALAVVAVLITGIPACIVITPLVYTILLTIVRIVHAVAPASSAMWARLSGGALAILEPAGATGPDADPAVRAARAVLIIALLFLPGALAIFALWVANRRLLGQVPVGYALERAGTREPNERDLEERQLRNVVEEMAVAAGVKPPRLLIIDSEAVNAAAVGVTIDDATVLVTRGLLDTLDRDETQAVVGHVIGSIGNGDLAIASIIHSIYQTWGALALLLNAPFASGPRRAIWRAFRAASRGRGRTVDRWEAEFVSEAFLRGAVDFEDGNEVGRRMAGGRSTDTAFAFVSLPTTMAAYIVRFAVFVSSMALIGPIVAYMWRTRRHLADAMAVQLTRNPDALARALRRFGTVRMVVPQGDAASLLFFAWPASATSHDAVIGQFPRMHPKLPQRERRLIALGADPALARPVAGLRAFLAQLVADLRRTHFSPKIVALLFAFFVLVPILSVVAVVLSVVVLVAMTGLTLLVMLVMMLMVTWIVNFLFLTIPQWIRRH